MIKELHFIEAVVRMNVLEKEVETVKGREWKKLDSAT